ncbi:MAG: hypothetical protein RQ733_08880 [Methyloprofundus sp.]|nr:hypothetical protein [Methyloprofundus sp.]
MDNIPENYTSKKFAVGWRRFIDWPDWIKPAGWHQEHDILHHYNLGERLDPDHLQHNLECRMAKRVKKRPSPCATY